MAASPYLTGGKAVYICFSVGLQSGPEVRRLIEIIYPFFPESAFWQVESMLRPAHESLRKVHPFSYRRSSDIEGGVHRFLYPIRSSLTQAIRKSV
jgi:hypothetical protein